MVRSAALFLALAISLKAESLEARVQSIAKEAIARFEAGGLTADKLAVTVRDLKTGETASYRGDTAMYPASVVKLFYLVGIHQQLENGKAADTPELRRAMHDMIVDSTNEATALVLDTITGTTSGPELPPAEMAQWQEKRNWVNRYFAGMGYTGINTNQKTFSEGPYGRERQGRGKNFENNNRLTTDATARLLESIVTGKAVSPERCKQMMELLQRNFTTPSKDPDDQAHGFSGSALPRDAKLWSKAGWTSTTRHDATYVELPNGAKYVAVIFTTDNAKRAEIIPFIAGELARRYNRAN